MSYVKWHNRFLCHEGGATAIEYGLIAAMLAIIVVAAVTILDTPVDGLFGSVVAQFNVAETFMD